MDLKKSIAVVVGDIGAARELFLTREAFEESGLRLTWFADAHGCAAKEVLEKGGQHYTMAALVGLSAVLPPFDAILIGTSATAVGAQIAWTRYGKENDIPVVWYEEMPGTGEREKTRVVSPDLMLVVDHAAQVISESVRPTLLAIPVGKPSFAEIPTLFLVAAERRARTRQRHGLRPTERLVTYWTGGESEARALVQLEALLAAMHLSTQSIWLAIRVHPKLGEAGKQRIYDLMKPHAPRVSFAYQDLDQNELHLASDVVVCEWGGSEAYAAALLGTPVILPLFPDDTELRTECGYPDGCPPILSYDLPHVVAVRDPGEFFFFLEQYVKHAGPFRAEGGRKSAALRSALCADDVPHRLTAGVYSAMC